MLETLNKGTIVISVFSHQETVLLGKDLSPNLAMCFPLLKAASEWSF